MIARLRKETQSQPFLDGPHDSRRVRRHILHRPCWPTESKSRKLLVASLLGTKNETTGYVVTLLGVYPKYQLARELKQRRQSLPDEAVALD